MATLVNNSSGNFTSAATWSVIDPTSLNANTTIGTSTTTTAFVSSAAFTPGAITIDGIGILFISRLSAGTGTISTRLAIAGVAVAGTTVTINASDITQSLSGWVFFKFAAPVTLSAATAYTVQMSSSVAGHTVARGSTVSDWCRYLRTTTTQAPAASDTLYINGEYISAGTYNPLTVTMNNTASTSFGSIFIGASGTLQAGVAASTNYQLINSGITVSGDGVLQLGTLATPVPATSSLSIQITQGGVAVTNGLLSFGNGKISIYGSPIIGRAYLAADAAAGATSITSNVSTGWKTGDKIVIASTTITIGEQETVTLGANASGTTITVPALGFAHSGTSPTLAEIGNITRNIKIFGDSATITTYTLFAATSVIDINNVEFYYLGSNTANKRGIEILASTGSFTMKGCSLHDFFALSGHTSYASAPTGVITIDDCVYYNNAYGIYTGYLTNPTSSYTNCYFFNSVVNCSLTSGTFSNMNCTGNANATSCTFNSAASGGVVSNNIIAHSNTNTGVTIQSTSYNTINYSNITSWRNLIGIDFTNSTAVVLDTAIAFGNSSAGIRIISSSNIEINNATINAGVTLTQPVGLLLSSSTFATFINNSTFGATTTHVTGDVRVGTANTYHNTIFNNCLLNSTTEIANQTNLVRGAILSSSKHDQTIKTHKSWAYNNITSYDSVIGATTSQRITPNTAASKSLSNTREFSIPAGKTATIKMDVRRSVAGDGTAYNGALPRLFLRANNLAGVTTDTLLATATVASLGAFETLIGSIPASAVDTVYSVFIDCDGTTGWININNWKLDIQNGSANSMANLEEYWNDGSSFQAINTTLLNNSGTELYWKDGAPEIRLFAKNSVQTGKFFIDFDE